eukprot:25274_1
MPALHLLLLSYLICLQGHSLLFDLETCFYHTTEEYVITPSQSILTSIVFNNTAIEIQFDIKLHQQSTDPSANIFSIANDHFDEVLSLDLNTIEDTFDIRSITNDSLTTTQRLYNASHILPLDNASHHIYYLLALDASSQHIFVIDHDMYWYYPAWDYISIEDESFTLYMSSPNEDSIHASVTNVCVQSTVAPNNTLNQISCGDTLHNVFVTGIETHSYEFNTNESIWIHIDDCWSDSDIILKIFDSNHVFISNSYCEGGDDCGYCYNIDSYRENFTMPLDAGTYSIDITAFDRFAWDYEFSVECFSIDTESKPETEYCVYNHYQNDTLSLLPAQVVFDDILIRHGSMEIEFTIKLDEYCNKSLCNIVYIGDDEYFRFLSISINGINDTFEVTTTYNYFYQDTISINSASALLPVDDKYHTLYLSYANQYNTQQTVFSVDDITDYQSIEWFAAFPTTIHLPLYMSSPWHNGIHASVQDICITSEEQGPLDSRCTWCDGEIQCGDIHRGVTGFPADRDLYYFNVTGRLKNVVFDTCGSGFNTYLQLFDMEMNVIQEGDDDGFCWDKEQLSVVALDIGEYILAVSGSYGETGISEYGHYKLEVDCRGFRNNTQYEVLGILTWIDQSQFEQELLCQRQFGTTLATITDEQDLSAAIDIIKHEGQIGRRLWIGYHKANWNQSKWGWIDGTPCNFTVSNDCKDDPHWDDGEPNFLTELHKLPSGGYIFVPEDDPYSAAFGDDGFGDWDFHYDGLCNKPNGKYPIRNCSDTAGCWHLIGNSTDVSLVGDTAFDVDTFEPPIAYWNSQLFVMGSHQLHYKNITLSTELHSKWMHKSYNTNNSYSIVTKSQSYAQYDASLYVYGFGDDSYNDTLIHIDLDTLEHKYITLPELISSDPYITLHEQALCIVATAQQVFIIDERYIFIYHIDDNTWQKVGKVFVVPSACAITIDETTMYTFGDLTGWDAIIKYDMRSDPEMVGNSIYLDTTLWCAGQLAKAITGNNGKIYIHGCCYGSWKTFVFDPKTELFEPETMNIDVPIHKHVPYYDALQLAKMDDNILISVHTVDDTYPIFHTGNEPVSIIWYYLVTESISIRFTITHSDIWPSNGIDIVYSVNDFLHVANDIYYVNFTDSQHMQIPVILNISSDDCICLNYKCSECHQNLNISHYLSPKGTPVDYLQLAPTHNYDFDVLLLPQVMLVSLHRCNLSLNVSEWTSSKMALSITLQYNLSTNCYSRHGQTFAASIIVSARDNDILSAELSIVIGWNQSHSCKICALYSNNSDCISCQNNRFTVVQEIDALEEGTMSVSITSNSNDLRVISWGDTIVFGKTDPHTNTITNDDLLWLLFLFLLPIIIAYALYKYFYTQYTEDVFVVQNALVLLIGIGQFDDTDQWLPGVQKCIHYLIELWRNTYKYDVMVCNPKSLYSTKLDIIDFMDHKLKMLEEKDYDCVIVHNISHGSKGTVQTSDGKSVGIDFIVHELQTQAEYTNNLKLLKLIFQHGCQGNADYSVSSTPNANRSVFSQYTSGGNTEYDTQNMGYESNCAIIAGNCTGRAMSDSGNFSRLILASFKRNLERTIKWSLDALIKEIRRDLETETNHAELVTVKENICYNTIRFEQSISQAMNQNVTNSDCDAMKYEMDLEMVTSNIDEDAQGN